MFRDTTSGFGIVSIFFHWVSAVGTLFLFGLGVYLTSYGYYASNFLEIAHLHYALGIVLLALVSIRLLWRLINRTPVTLAKSMTAKIGIKLIKFLLYVSLFAVLLSGYFICTAEGQTINVFNLFQVPSFVLLETSEVNIAGLTHKYVAWGLLALVAVHAAAALFHHFFVKDRTLLRMIRISNTTKSGFNKNPDNLTHP